MNYEQMKKEYMRGWHTWNVRSVLSHVHMPDGLAVNLAFKEYASGAYLKETLIGRFGDEDEKCVPGLHAFDGSYTEMTVRWKGMEMTVESAVDGDELMILVSPKTFQPKPAMLVVETSYLWGRRGYTIADDDVISAHGADGVRKIFCSGKPMNDPNIPVQSAYLSVMLDGPVVISSGSEISVEYARSIIEARRRAVLAGTEKYGEFAGLYQALECTLAWDTVYDAKNDRVVSPVSRLWSIGSGGYVLFCWDNFFAGFMASLGCKELAYCNLMEILREGEDLGFVPNFAYATGQKSADRSQPPVGSKMLLETYRRFREKWIVEEMYPGLMKWNTWFRDHRSAESGALCWGSDPIPVQYGNVWEYEHHGINGRFGAALESGLDNSPMYDDIPFDKEKHILKLEDVGLTGLFIMDCRALIELAKIVGREDDIPELESRIARAEAGLEGMWDEEHGFYYNRRTDTGEFSRRISPCNFYALFSERVTAERARRIADEHYYNPEEFYGKWMLPSIARNDAAFADQHYWRGRVWAPLNFLVYLALTDTGLDDVRRDLAEKSTAIFMKEWNEHRHVHENYNSITGEGCDSMSSDKFYHWGALLAVIALAEAGFVPDMGKKL
ncbi:MAG: hypothetical protein IJC56_00710 [Clostridia bacterium]|nr:hypothetical protein [Clostridia bacterium]